ncbi:proline and serine-rich protein 2 [Sceloporus undulatus]|uniref:proline and serine-rich protein 2 n=1 Tax=Sceloporus undulatus TaxID=8520 RepID=UPI001C4A8F0C|nr:proline and serine-rich protein 2 [Sceloporus undulatus]XP_042325814.1 proline and serine-rich protein 2 [Sceloporus undulatus]XP_042325815.1 proline and serine-rich protein 2 [Sceloporus undulatus]
MPRNMMSDFSGMVCEIPPEIQFGSFEKNHHLESGKSRPRRRGSTLDDDETLKYLTLEEKDVLLFFEETIDSLEDDLEEQALHDSGIHCHSPKSMEENMSSHSESEDIIDLVQPGPETRESVSSRITDPALDEVWKPDKSKLDHIKPPDEEVCADTVPVQPSAPPLPMYEVFPPPPPVQHPKLPRSIPTPLVIAQKISEKQAEGSSFSPTSPKEGKFVERRSMPASSPLHNGERFTAFRQSAPPPTAPKPQRFPSNISITNIGEREFSKTISNAAVNVQERKARVLANVNGSSFLTSEGEERLQRYDISGHGRSSSLRDLPSEQARQEALSRLGLVEDGFGQAQLDHSGSVLRSKEDKPDQGQVVSNGYGNIHEILKRESSLFPSMSKTVTFKPDSDLMNGKPARQNATKSFYEYRPPPDFSLDIRRRSGSLPRPSGLRPQGITVQFSGRGSTEEARREALRKLGLLKE